MIHYQYIVEIDAFTGVTVETQKFSGSPAFSVNHEPFVRDPGLIKVEAFTSGKTFGASKNSIGEVILNNYAEEAIGITDGPLDYLKEYGLDGRPIRVYQGLKDDIFANFTKIIDATIESVDFSWDEVTFKIKSKQAELNIPLDGGIFLGDNILPDGVEGVETDLKGRTKPILIGRIFNAKPILCNTSKLIYSVSPSTGIEIDYVGAEFKVYDNGVPLEFGVSRADEASLLSNAPSAGAFDVYPEGGLLRLGSSPSGIITFSGASNGRSVTAKVSNLVSDILTLAGKSSLIDAASFAALESSANQECGIYLSKSTSISVAIDLICSACGAYWYFNLSNKVVLKQFVDPNTLAVDYAITTNTPINNFKRSKIKDTKGGIPAYKVTTEYAKNYTVGTNVAGSVADSRKAWLAEEFRKLFNSDTDIITKHPTSEELIIRTSMTRSDDIENLRLFDLYSVDREIVSFELLLEFFTDISGIQLGQCFELSLNGRFDYTAKKMALIGFTADHESEKVALTLWG